MAKAPVITSVTPAGPHDLAAGETSPVIVVVGKEFDVEAYEVRMKHTGTGLESEPGTVEFNMEDATPEELELIVTPLGTGYRGVVEIDQTNLTFTVSNP